MRSVMNHNFGLIPDVKLQRSIFDRSYGVKTTFDGGYLIPVFVDEVLPGDTFNVQSTFFARLATPLTPFMDNLVMDSFYFFVPNRLLWDNWQRFYGEQDNPADSTDYTVPLMDSTAAPLSTTGYLEGSLSDYLGLPTKVTGIDHISLYHRAYNLIWNQWFRDENLQDSVTVDKDNGPDDPADYVLLKRGKRRDYFTSALPWPQKPFAGITDVTLPLGTTAPVIGNGMALGLTDATDNFGFRHTGTGSAGFTTHAYNGTVGAAVVAGDPSTANKVIGVTGNRLYSGLEVDLTNATAASINALRQAFQIQRLLEQQARGGTRYIERLRVEFQVVSPDARLQRAELLALGSTPVNIHPVANTASVTAANSPTGAAKFQGDLTATGTVTSTNNGFVKSFVEHGVLIGLVCVRADLNYVQGLDRKFTRQTAFDYYRPVLANLGEQAILRKELFCDGSANDEDVWGYIPRYDEYRHNISKITGLFRFNATGTLETWHLAQELDGSTDLNDDFISENPPIDRVIAVPSQPHFILDGFHRIKNVRAMPSYSVPGYIDHF